VGLGRQVLGARADEGRSGAWPRPVRWAQENLAQVPATGDATLPQLNLVLPLALAGDLDGAEAAFNRAEVARIGRSPLALLEVEEARRWIEAGRGHERVAVKLALGAADLAESMGVNDSYAWHCTTPLASAARPRWSAAFERSPGRWTARSYRCMRPMRRP
jgi:hypothetical protein